MTQTVPEYGGCPWPVDPACLGDEWADLDPSIQDRATALAGETLRRLTGYRVGGCAIVVRPCKQACVGMGRIPPYWGQSGPFTPHIGVQGYWINSCGCTTDCSCTELCVISLPPPVGEVYEVKLDGEIIPDTDYKVYGNELAWIGDGDCPWPTCQDLTAADDEVGSFSITYLNAYPVDALGAYAAGVLAYEYAQACQGNKCRLPSNVTTLSRQGVSMELATGSFPGGFTGIREVDAFIAIYNPGGVRQQSTVWSPDVHSPRVER